MAKRMLVDATHPEETRVAVVNGNRLEELDFEIASRKQLKGNIYLAKVTRVEPSLQAAFVEYGGNRHGFLAFSEIHPDYYRIPMADREALLAEERRLEEQAEARAEAAADGAVMAEPIRPEQVVEEWSPMPSPIAPEASDEEDGDENGDDAEAGEEQAAPSAAAPDTLGGDEDEEAETQRRRSRPLRSYKIQEVVKRRQVMLVQVTKEERGNKGAALTTYLSLPGRYCVLMPNTGRGGGISRKITNPADRKRLKEILSDLDIPDGMAVILRTAGLERSKPEIKRDLEYLLRLWDDIREQTLKSSAPCLIYEEANLIKRSIRDLYANDIDEIWVEGEAGFRTAREFMDMLMPGHSQRVQLYRDTQIPLFHRYQVETQIDAIHSPVVQLRSGGYIVINPTEALVSIDVNSGKSTRERNIEETAYKTNLEAADEVARQLRLRDLAGLIVIDFIDMEEPRNNAAVERRMKEAMKNDRARIQLGRISAFGLLELSRQRLRPSLLETNFERCPHCSGTGVVRSVESASLHVLRAIEEEGIRKRSAEITIFVPTSIALYILNQKRGELAKIEERHAFSVMVQADDTLIAPDHRLERNKARLPDEDGPLVSADRVMAETDRALAAEPVETVEEPEAETEAVQVEETGERAEANGDGNGEDRRRRRRRRRGRGRDREEGRTEGDSAEGESETDEADQDGVQDGDESALPVAAEAIPSAAISEPESDSAGAEGDDGDEDDGEDETGADAGERNGDGRKKRRRGKRGGRRRSRREGAEGLEGGDETADQESAAAPVQDVPAQIPAPAEASDLDWILAGEAAPAVEEALVPVIAAEPPVTTPAEAAKAPARKASRKRKAAAEAPAEAAAPAVVAEAPAKGRKRKAAAAVEAPVEAVAEAAPAKKASRKRKAAAEAPVEVAPEPTPAPIAEAPAKGRKRKAAAAVEAPAETVAEAAPAKKASRKRKAAAEAPAEVAPDAAPAPAPEPAATTASNEADADAKPRRGWWKR
ncbi:ribonuclease E [Azospirillum lipoferum]|uniref:Ribonuclease E n=1 Tax=Azospirillum lipoferum TaxID=193 RepID=A0A5A9GB53_AZOLI|nr:MULTISPECIES: ribonuclease E/G [Azospirillum]KAA0591720.1 Rne/Rng family ribonuclease [Azospirillum lipoferum]MCP1614891.1 ribonuclease E [Azospirillum lipoferum]MDW5536358.1 Rne/Rng family ribonuclease [Azospirillum sp. NL1]